MNNDEILRKTLPDKDLKGYTFAHEFCNRIMNEARADERDRQLDKKYTIRAMIDKERVIRKSTAEEIFKELEGKRYGLTYIFASQTKYQALKKKYGVE